MGRTYAQVLDLGREQMDEALITRYRNPMALKLVQMIGRMDQEGDDEALRRLFRIAEERDEVKALREERDRYKALLAKTGTNE